MKRRFWDEIDEQETLKREIKIETEKLKNINKINAYEIKAQEIKDEAKRKREGLRIERINKLQKIEGIKTDVTELRIRMKFNRIS